MATDYINSSAHMTMECDICTKEIEFNGDWKECIASAKREGWIIVKHTDGDWYHFCSKDCRGKL